MSVVHQVLVLSSGRSGSTLLDRLLGRHPDVASLGEVMQWPKNIVLDTLCTCGEPMSQCVFWQQVAAGLQQSIHINVSTNPYSLDMGFIGATRVRDEAYYTRQRRVSNVLTQAVLWVGQRLGFAWRLPLAQRQVRHSVALYEAARAASGASIVVDSSKHYLRGISIYQHAPEHTKLIVLVRDGRAVMHSRMQTGLSMRDAVGRWQRYYQRMLPCLHASVPDEAIFYLHYEDLAQSPNETLSALFAFLGLPEIDVLNLPDAAVHMAEGNAMRFKPLDVITLDQRWTSGLSVEARDYFKRQAGALNQELGYDGD